MSSSTEKPLVEATQVHLQKGSFWHKFVFIGLTAGVACLGGSGYLYSQTITKLNQAHVEYTEARTEALNYIEIHDEEGANALAEAESSRLAAEWSLNLAESVVALYEEAGKKLNAKGTKESVVDPATLQALEQSNEELKQKRADLEKLQATFRVNMQRYQLARQKFAEASERFATAEKAGKGQVASEFYQQAKKEFEGAKTTFSQAKQAYDEQVQTVYKALAQQKLAQIRVDMATMTPAQLARGHVEAKSELNKARTKLEDITQAEHKTYKTLVRKQVEPSLREKHDHAEHAFHLAKDAKQQFWYSYLTAFVFFLSLGLGGLFFTMVQHLTRAGWSIVVRRVAENVMITLPFTCILGIPLVLGTHDLFHWTHHEVVRADVMLSAKVGYLNSKFFYIRLAAYAVVWTILTSIFYRWSTKQDHAKDAATVARLSHKMRGFAAPALILFALTSTFAAFDLLMSLDPHWFSTMFGVYFFAGSALTFNALLAVLVITLRASGYLQKVVTVEHLHDIGKLMFGFTVFWTYIAFSQYFLIWYANIPEETVWFSYRIEDDFLTLTVILVFGRFIIPFFFLLQRSVKRNSKLLLLAGLWIITMQLVDMYWLIQPVLAHQFAIESETHHLELAIGPIDYLNFFALGGFFVGVFCWALRRNALVPMQDPRLSESLHFENF